jgi:hypothetical protein
VVPRGESLVMSITSRGGLPSSVPASTLSCNFERFPPGVNDLDGQTTDPGNRADDRDDRCELVRHPPDKVFAARACSSPSMARRAARRDVSALYDPLVESRGRRVEAAGTGSRMPLL